MVNRIKEVLIFLSCIIISFIAGRMTANKLSKIEASSKSSHVETVKALVSTQAEIQKDSTTVKQTIIVAKHYSNAGKLQLETVTHVNYASAQNKTQIIAQNESINKKVEIQTSQKMTETFKSNWELGVSAPMLDYRKPNIDLGYRLFGDLYLHGEANIIDKTGSIGFFILL